MHPHYFAIPDGGRGSGQVTYHGASVRSLAPWRPRTVSGLPDVAVDGGGGDGDDESSRSELLPVRLDCTRCNGLGRGGMGAAIPPYSMLVPLSLRFAVSMEEAGGGEVVIARGVALDKCTAVPLA